MQTIELARAPEKEKTENQKRFLEFLNREEPPCDYERQLIRKHEKRITAIFQGKIVPPYEVEIQPSSKCNLNCKYCFGKALTQNRIKDKIGIKELENIAQKINAFKENSFEIETIKFCGTTGEPLVNPASLYGIDLFKNLGKKVIFFTNGLWLDKKLENKQYMDYILEADGLRASLDCGSEKTFEELKGRKGFQRIVKNLEELVKRKGQTGSKLNIIIGYVIGKENCEGIVKATRLMQDIGVDEIRFRVDITKPQTIHELSNVIVYETNKAKYFRTKDFKVTSVYSTKDIKEDTIFHAHEKKCFNQHFWACIGPDCKLYACGHRTYHEVEPYGNLLENSFKELWTSKKRLENLKNLPDEYCKFCSPSSKRRNDFMDFLKSLNNRK